MATLRFVKLHGTANDFVYVDAREGFPGDPAALAPRLCDRRRGIGADGLILLLPPADGGDCRMVIYNADGSRPEMCGNGIRGLAKFVHDRGLARANPLRIETDAGVKTVEAELAGGRVARVTVDMGVPVWDGRQIPVDADGEVVERPLEVAGRAYRVTCLSMGNPHCVVFVDDVDGLPLAEIGPRFERHPFFPRRVNTEFVRATARDRLVMRVWERGAGETHDEHVQVVREVVRLARGRVPVIAGTGSNSTAEAIRLTRGAEEAGADGALLISPYYNKPTQEGIYRHYATVAEATRLPIILYNIPGRTASNMTPETIGRLSRIGNIVGVKEASGSLAQVLEIIEASGPDFAIYSGDDILTLPIMAVGGKGVIAVTANLVPREFAELAETLLAGDLERSRGLMHRLLPLVHAMSLEVNPIPVKTALALMGQCAEEFRLPLTCASAATRAKLESVLREYELVC